MKVLRLFITIAFLFALSSNLHAVEKAERISDREIIEALAGLRGDIKAMDERFKAIDERFNAMDKRFEDVDKRFDDLHHRINDIMSLLQILIAVLSVVGAGIFGTLLLMWRKITRLEQIADEVAFLKDAYLRLQDQITYLLKPSKGAL